MSRSSRVSIKGAWPGTVILRSGWAKAVARPWHDDDDRASLRSERGGSAFLAACARRLVELGASGVMSAPVFVSDLETWTEAGFVPDRELMMMTGSLRRPTPSRMKVVEARPEDVTAIDDAAFEGDWRIGRLGIIDALHATPTSVLLATDHVPPLGYTIVGVSATTGYLQRIAVEPAAQHRGVGRELLRGAMSWARRSGGTSMLLNTQPDNIRAIALYRTEGFTELADRLHVMRWEP